MDLKSVPQRLMLCKVVESPSFSSWADFQEQKAATNNLLEVHEYFESVEDIELYLDKMQAELNFAFAKRFSGTWVIMPAWVFEIKSQEP